MSYVRIPTTEKLATALEELRDPRLERMIELARAGYYDDYKSTIAFPIVQLVIDLRQMGLDELVERAKNGEFDAQRWEADEWAQSEEGQATFRELLGGLPHEQQ